MIMARLHGARGNGVDGVTEKGNARRNVPLGGGEADDSALGNEIADGCALQLSLHDREGRDHLRVGLGNVAGSRGKR